VYPLIGGVTFSHVTVMVTAMGTPGDLSDALDVISRVLCSCGCVQVCQISFQAKVVCPKSYSLHFLRSQLRTSPM
jgi:hypothetical protein